MKSLSTKIVFFLAIISLLSILLIFNVFENINKEAFYSVEMEKANLVVSTIEPSIALNIYLGMESRNERIILQLMQNPNILAIKIFNQEKIINEKKSKEYNANLEDVFVVNKNLYQPNSNNKIGSLVLVYSNENYKELVHKYTKLLIQVLFALAMFFFIFGLYVKQLLSPLKSIAKLLKNYSPEKKINIPFQEQSNEIGLISKSLNNMQQSILKYSEQQHNINKYLEEKVSAKTLEIRTQLYTNSLTGLPNRLSLLEDIKIFSEGALLIINIDDFKEINDFFGQLAGNNVLISLAKKIELMFAKDENITVVHLGGDEFALFFMKRPFKNDFREIAQTLISDIEKMVFLHEKNELSIRVTIGASYQMKEALEKADIALKSAKKQGKSFLLYDEKLNVEKQYKNNMEWVKKLHTAIENDKIIPYFQAIYDNKTNSIVSYESLIRLIDEDDNLISPYKFLTIAKKSKLYPKLTKIMVEKSCQYFEHRECDFSVNLSVEDMLDEETVKNIEFNVKKYDVSKKIVFEILETEEIETYDEISQFITNMKALGCRIAIDDFGSGYSNFAYLLRLKIDYIKIDGSLIKNLDTDLSAKMIVETIVSFAKKLDMMVVAEYVHNEEIFEKIKELDIDRSQGFYLAKPQEQITL
jgi:c-di-GMP phosphodiesterase